MKKCINQQNKIFSIVKNNLNKIIVEKESSKVFCKHSKFSYMSKNTAHKNINTIHYSNIQNSTLNISGKNFCEKNNKDDDDKKKKKNLENKEKDETDKKEENEKEKKEDDENILKSEGENKDNDKDNENDDKKDDKKDKKKKEEKIEDTYLYKFLKWLVGDKPELIEKLMKAVKYSPLLITSIILYALHRSGERFNEISPSPTSIPVNTSCNTTTVHEGEDAK
jgi:hypothetical protein